MAELASQPTSIQSIYTWYNNGKINVNRRYQRKLVWTLEEKQRLIESILNRYPIPAILLAEQEKTGTYEIIDGLQRLHAIISFIQNSFPTLDGKYFDLDYFPTAKAKAEEGVFSPSTSDLLLDREEVSLILDYTLALSIMRHATKEEINDVFARINTYGHRLSDQERRQAGVQNHFSEVVRTIACEIRGDSSLDLLPLSQMPSISIDLPMSNHGYDVKAEDVFWVQQGILRSTDLRDSADEQCIADIVASIVGGELLARSKVALDNIYKDDTPQSKRVLDGLDVHGSDRIIEEFKYCIAEIEKVTTAIGNDKLRDIIYEGKNSNAFPSTFSAIFIAFYESLILNKKKISNYFDTGKALTNLSTRIESSRKGTSPDERRKNINMIKGLISSFLVDVDNLNHVYGSHTHIDIEHIIRRSEVELPNYELKQGLLRLDNSRSIDDNIIPKVIKTICAIANNGPKNTGTIIIGIVDNESDKDRVSKLDKIEAKRIGKKYVVGVAREATVLNLTIEDYFTKWKEGIRNSELSDSLRDEVLSNIDYNEFFGLGLIVIKIPPQKEVSYYQDEIYYRSGDETKKAEKPKEIANIVKRF